MRKQIFLCIFIFLSLAAYAKDEVACDNDFGTSIQVFSEYLDFEGRKVDLQGDFNGDGIMDHLVVLVVNKESVIRKGIVSSNPFLKGTGPRPPDVISPEFPVKNTLALGIIQRKNTDNKECQKFVIYSQDFFPYPAEKLHKGFLVRIDRVGSEWYLQWKKYSKRLKRLKHDAIFVSTDVGDVLIYWNGHDYAIDWFEMVDD
jgi:hypothetical protein